MINKKYLPNGQAVHLSEKLASGDGYLIYPLYVDEHNDAEIDYDSPQIVDKIFNKPPTAIFGTRILQLKNEIKKLKDQKEKLIKSLNEDRVYLNDTKNSLKRKFSKYDQLKHLLDFIDLKITHYVIIEYGAKIVSITDETKHIDDYDPVKYGQKLLTLYGKYPKELNWKLNEHSDGSGKDSIVFPCTSYAEAVCKIKAFIDEQVREWRNNKMPYLMESILETAREYKIPVASDYVIYYREYLQAELDRKKAKKDRYEDRLLKEIQELNKIKTEATK